MELYILIEKILDRRDHPIIDGAAEDMVSYKALSHVAFIIFFSWIAFSTTPYDGC
jgi:hypothetical protein